MTMVDLALHSYSLRMHYLNASWCDVFAFIDDAVCHGFSGVNISLSGKNYRHLSGSSKRHIHNVRDRLNLEKLSVEIDTDRVEPEHLKEILGVAEMLGARKVRTFTHYPFGAELMRRTVEDLRAVAPEAEAAEIEICLENHEEFNALELVEIVQAVASPNVHLLFDYGNSLPVLETPEELLASVLPWIGAVHMKDEVIIAPDSCPSGVPTMLGVPLGTGTIDVLGLTRQVTEAGLRRICLQSVWGYSVPLGKLRPVDLDSAAIGHGVFALSGIDGADPMLCFDAETLEPSRAILLESEALGRSVQWLDQNLCDIGIKPRRALHVPARF